MRIRATSVIKLLSDAGNAITITYKKDSPGSEFYKGVLNIMVSHLGEEGAKKFINAFFNKKLQ